MSSPDLGLYVSSNNVDYGPLSLKEATERVQSGEFKPTDLGWHQGVSGWVPLKKLPEWSQMQAPPALPITKKKNPDSSTEDSIPQMGTAPKKAKLRSGSTIPTESGNSMDGFADEKIDQPTQSGGIGGKILIAFAVLIFLATLVFIGWICWRKWDDIILQF
jgi:hypothetical protein